MAADYPDVLPRLGWGSDGGYSHTDRASIRVEVRRRSEAVCKAVMEELAERGYQVMMGAIGLHFENPQRLIRTEFRPVTTGGRYKNKLYGRIGGRRCPEPKHGYDIRRLADHALEELRLEELRRKNRDEREHERKLGDALQARVRQLFANQNVGVDWSNATHVKLTLVLTEDQCQRLAEALPAIRK